MQPICPSSQPISAGPNKVANPGLACYLRAPLHLVVKGSTMQESIWRWFGSVWRDVNAFRDARIAANERRQVELTCCEHGMLWLVDQRYAGMIPAPVATQRRRKATR